MRTFKKSAPVTMFLDIETIPEPGSKDPKTALKGEFGEILCIGIDTSSSSRFSFVRTCLKGTEIEILWRFWEIAASVDLFVGHHIYEFDLPFIYKRSIIKGVKPSKILNFARYRRYPIYDTMCEWSRWARGPDGYIKLDTLAKILGVQSSKRDFTGELVATAHAAGLDEKIFSYCMDDVRVVREVYERMEFIKNG